MAKSPVLSLRCRLLLLGDGSLARSLAGTCVGVRALSTDRQIAAMAISAIGTDFDETLDVHRNVLAQIAFHHAFRFNDLADAVDLVFIEILHLLSRVNFGFRQNARRSRVADAVNISQRDIHALLTRKIDACNTCHVAPLSLDAACAWS